MARVRAERIALVYGLTFVVHSTKAEEKKGKFAEIVVRVQAGDALWVEYLVAPVNETHGVFGSFLRVYCH